MELLDGEPLDSEKLAQLANTVRFQKKNYLQKVENIHEHMHSFTLTMKDIDLEYEWRLIEIHSRKTMSIVSSIVVLLQDLFWTFLLTTVSLPGKTIKIVIDICVFLSLYQVFFSKKVRNNKIIMQILNQGN